MENKKKKRELREKNDTILKMSVLSDTMHLTNEEFGALIRMVMTEDDRDDKRYNGMKGFVLNEFKKKEQEWEKSFEQLTENNKTLISAFSTVFGKADKSHTSFLQFKEQYENNDNGTQGDLDGEEWITKDIMIFNEEKNELEKWQIEFQKKNENNIPNEEINNLSYDEIIRTMNAGYENYWNKHWKKYLENTDF